MLGSSLCHFKSAETTNSANPQITLSANGFIKNKVEFNLSGLTVDVAKTLLVCIVLASLFERALGQTFKNYFTDPSGQTNYHLDISPITASENAAYQKAMITDCNGTLLDGTIAGNYSEIYSTSVLPNQGNPIKAVLFRLLGAIVFNAFEACIQKKMHYPNGNPATSPYFLWALVGGIIGLGLLTVAAFFGMRYCLRERDEAATPLKPSASV